MNTRKFDKKIDQFVRNNPKYSRQDLCYSVVPKNQHFVQLSPGQAMAGLKTGTKQEDYETYGPVVYGPSLIIVDHKSDTVVGIFPL